MVAWQGPALCCYNDAVFSPADLRNISRIGQDSKLDKPAATGRCGVNAPQRLRATLKTTSLGNSVGGRICILLIVSIC